jgi:hypothetical protein
VALGDHGQKHRHGLGIHPWKNQAVHDAVMWTDSGERIAELAHQSSTYTGSDTNWCPATPGFSQ